MNLEEAIHLLVRLNPVKEQEKFEDVIRTIMQEAAVEARHEGYQQSLADGKRRAVK